MQQFIAKFQKDIQGVMSGFDRVLFRHLLVKHVYGGDDKEKIARAYAAERGITEGDVCALTALELAPTFQHYKTDMLIRPRPCFTIYHYRIDPDSGWRHARMQTWLTILRSRRH